MIATSNGTDQIPTARVSLPQAPQKFSCSPIFHITLFLFPGLGTGQGSLRHLNQMGEPGTVIQSGVDKKSQFGARIRGRFFNLANKFFASGRDFDEKLIVAYKTDNFLVAVNSIFPKHFAIRDRVLTVQLVDNSFNKGLIRRHNNPPYQFGAANTNIQPYNESSDANAQFPDGVAVFRGSTFLTGSTNCSTGISRRNRSK